VICKSRTLLPCCRWGKGSNPGAGPTKKVSLYTELWVGGG
jgi:hypothetical protein